METGISTLQNSQKIALDTMIFIYHLENNLVYQKSTSKILRSIEIGEKQGVTSTITLLELLVKPMQMENQAIVENYTFALTTFPNLRLCELSTEIAVKSAELRAKYRISMPDAIQIATAIIEESDHFITNDQSLNKIEEISIIPLDQLKNT